MERSGTADMSLWGGGIPKWLFQRMVQLTKPIVESILLEKGHQEFLSRMSDPFWFQSFGAVIGMDWNSSGVTTAVTRALKYALNPYSKELGLYVCGGKGKNSRNTPQELIKIGDQTGLDGGQLAYASRLTAKVDNTAIQDGFQIYLHSFILSAKGDWTVIQQGMDGENGLARRYHWHSANVKSFVEEPHSGVVGENKGMILNLTHQEAKSTKNAIVEITQEKPAKILSEVPYMKLPDYCDVKVKDVDLQRLGGILYVAQENNTQTFEDILMLQGLGPRTLQALTLVSEVIHGTPSRFKDPARFAFAHGGKSSKPFAVPTKVYDETITHLQESVEKAKIGDKDKLKAISKLTKIAQRAEKNLQNDLNFNELKQKQNAESHKLGGRSIYGKSKPPKENGQLNLF